MTRRISGRNTLRKLFRYAKNKKAEGITSPDHVLSSLVPCVIYYTTILLKAGWCLTPTSREIHFTISSHRTRQWVPVSAIFIPHFAPQLIATQTSWGCSQNAAKTTRIEAHSSNFELCLILFLQDILNTTRRFEGSRVYT